MNWPEHIIEVFVEIEWGCYVLALKYTDNNIIVHCSETEKEMLVYVTLPADQTVGAVVTCEFLIGSDIFSREAKLGDFYGNVFCSLLYVLC